jgi:hypothetical protein
MGTAWIFVLAGTRRTGNEHGLFDETAGKCEPHVLKMPTYLESNSRMVLVG